MGLVLRAAGAPAEQTVTITASDGEPGGVDCEAFILHVDNLPPTAKAGGPYLVGLGNGLTLDASGSWDPGNDIVSYAWDLNDNGQYELQTDSPVLVEPPAETALLGEGTHTIGLRVTDSGGLTSTATATLEIGGGDLAGTAGDDKFRIASTPRAAPLPTSSLAMRSAPPTR